MAQSVKELLRKQSEQSKNEESPAFLGGRGKAALSIKAVLVDQKKVQKLDPFPWAGVGAWAGAVQGQVAGVWAGAVQG